MIEVGNVFDILEHWEFRRAHVEIGSSILIADRSIRSPVRWTIENEIRASLFVYYAIRIPSLVSIASMQKRFYEIF